MSDPGLSASPPLAARGDAVGASVLIVIGLLAWATSRDLPFGTLGRPGAGFFPTVLSVILTGLGTVILAGAWRGTGGVDLRELRAEGEALRRAGIAAALLLGAIAVVEWIGFPIAVGLLCAAMVRRFGGRGWRPCVLFGAGVGLAVWLVFGLWLRVNLPVGRLFG